MPQILTNPSLQRSIIQSKSVSCELDKYIKLYISNDTDTKVINIFNGIEYNFTFYDPHYGTLRSLTGLVTNICEDQIRVKYISNTDNLDCTKCNKKCSLNKNSSSTAGSVFNIAEPPMPTCSCILNPPNTCKYDGPKTIFIPIKNITNALYIQNNKPERPPKDNKKGEVRVMLLGISATVVKAIIVRLDFIDDQIENAVKYVELKTGAIYDIAYENKGSIFESRVKIVGIEEDRDGCECNRYDKNFVRENVGMHNSIYTTCINSDKEEYMKSPPVKRVKIIVDTSELFTGRLEVIMLDSIRNCALVQDVEDTPLIPAPGEGENDFDFCKCCEYKTEFCDPFNCTHHMHYPPKPPMNDHCHNDKAFVYTYDNRFKATVIGDKVEIVSKDGTDKLDLDSLIKFYLGVD